MCSPIWILVLVSESSTPDLSVHRTRSAEAAARKMTTTTRRRPLKVPEMALRVCVIPLALASLWEMATNKQANDTYGEISFSNLSGFKYLVFINAVTAAYSVVSILMSSFKSLARYDWLIFLLDQAAAYLLVTSCSAAAELVYLAMEGDREVSWGEVCSYFGRFCGRATVSVALQAAALLCFVALSLVSAFRVFREFDAPGAHVDCSGDSDSKQEGRG
ncbi:CASP-like protein 2D1 [Triticum urartu]|uniref:CASP-like protein n=3 Tax=Triticum TaxID=4564 RepID=A0A8R7UV60_TRIUA|nr:CASP-like protein 2D1 [Triticum aestivum]XP_048534443.1 CASP-like protein 2D1 [Triticum urartu]